MATPIFCCGFECGQLGTAGQHWTAATGISISTGTVRSGARSLRCNPTAATAQTDNGVGASTITVFRFYIRFTTLPSADTTLVWVNNCGLGFKQSDSKLYAVSGTGPFTTGATGAAVTTGVWYRIDLKIDQTTITNVTADVQVDGVALGQRAFNQGGTSGTISLGSRAAVSGDWFYDDWIHSYTSADYPIGAGYVNHFVPTSDGTHTATTTTIVKGTIAAPTGGGNVAGSTDVFNWVDGVPLLGGASDNTRLVNQQTAGATLYAEVIFGPAPGISTPTAAPRAVEVLTADREASTATCNFQTKLNDNGTENAVVNRGTVAGVTSDRYANKHYALAPTGGAWTVAAGAGNFNNIRARFGYSSDATPDVYWRGIMIEAEFVEVAAVFIAKKPYIVGQSINRAGNY